MTGPYIVTTKRRRPLGSLDRPDATGVLVLSRVAVATLKAKEVSLALYKMLPGCYHMPLATEQAYVVNQISRLPESGGTITLPDGTVKVEPTTWRDLLPDRLTGESLARLRWAERGDMRPQQRILDAFNAQEAKR